MSSRLPEFVDPWRLADQRRVFAGAIELNRLPRLCEALMSNRGNAEFELRFEPDQQRRVRVKGSVTATLVLECQRCLGPLHYPVQSNVDLTVIEVLDEIERLPEESDPLLAEEGRIRPMDLVEDELLLSLPQVPRHNPDACGVDVDTLNRATIAAQQEQETPGVSPFAVLAGLKSHEQK